jgi:hypothetical protein
VGANFIFAVIPKCQLARKREEKLVRHIKGLKEEELERDWTCVFPDDSELESIKTRLLECVEAYKELSTYTSVGEFEPEDSYPVWITGGVTWGDPPTDIYDEIYYLAEKPEIWDMLVKWAKEDQSKG